MTPTPHAHTWHRAAAFLLLLLMCVMLGVVPGRAEAQSAANSKFDHFKTGFPLNGAHATQRCESCHTNGIFKGTPKDCQTCHTQGARQAKSNVVMPPTHIPTNASTQGCDSCHGTQSFSNPRFSHTTGIPPGTACQTCHDGVRSQGKPGNHIATRASCDSCHTTRNWNGAKPDHSGFNLSTNCASCHNGSAASGKTASHIPVSANCVSCHSVNGWKPTSWNHTQVMVSGTCSTCHSGSFPPADGKPGNHIPYQSLAGVSISNCDSCHKNGFSSWNPGRFHANVSIVGQCASCHLTSAFGLTSKPNTATHSGVTGGCESCHTTSGWAGAKVDHSLFNATTTCSNCHNGGTATGKPSTHIPTTENCFNCHSTTGWTPTKWPHPQGGGQCATCHNGRVATGKPGSHIPVSVDCTSCHSVNSWKPTSWNHTQVMVAGTCSTCHSGSFPPADGKPANHIPYQSLSGVAISNCDSCHKSGYSSWNPGRFHANVSIVGQCASCHLTSAFGLTSKPNTATHSTVTGGCESCHNTSGWSGAKVDHSRFNDSTNCSTCHNGSTATGKTSNHIPTSINCFSCHNTTGWTPTKWNHTQVTVTGICSTCHSGAFPPADGKPSNHIPYQSVAGLAITNCDTCHKGGFSSWNPVGFHTNGIKVVGQCSTCHTGAFLGPGGKPNNHIPYQQLTGVAISNCDSCHKSGFGSWNPGRFHNNVSIVGQCASCHLTSVYGLTSKPNTATHSGVTGGCESCHNTSSWSNAKVDHSLFNATTPCANCHNGSSATGKPGSHIPVTASCYSCHYTTGWTPTKWNHTQVTVAGTCSTCHSGAFPPADGKPSNHIPYQALTGAAIANCDSCHKNGTSAWNPGRFHANINIVGQCSTCHSGAFPPADGKPSNHIPYQALTGTSITNCDSCHKSGFSAWNPGRFHANVSIVGQCSTCHLSAAYSLTSKPNTAVHASIASNCESCHKSTASWTNVIYTHAVTNAIGTGTCDNCHNNSTATGKPSNHIPIQVGGVKCDSCHKSQQAWATSAKTNHTAMSTQACKTCHTQAYVGWGATAKPNNHIPEVQLLNGSNLDCKDCHTSTNSGGFGTAVMNHNNSTGSGSGWCYACHNAGTAYLGSMERKSLTHQKKTGVTDCSQSGCHRPLGSKGNTYRSWN